MSQHLQLILWLFEAANAIELNIADDISSIVWDLDTEIPKTHRNYLFAKFKTASWKMHAERITDFTYTGKIIYIPTGKKYWDQVSELFYRIKADNDLTEGDTKLIVNDYREQLVNKSNEFSIDWTNKTIVFDNTSIDKIKDKEMPTKYDNFLEVKELLFVDIKGREYTIDRSNPKSIDVQNVFEAAVDSLAENVEEINRLERVSGDNIPRVVREEYEEKISTLTALIAKLNEL